MEQISEQMLLEEKAGKKFRNGQIPTKVNKNKSPKEKKLQTQLEGLCLISKLINEILEIGLKAIKNDSLEEYYQFSNQMEVYQLSGPQTLLRYFILEMEALKKNDKRCHYERGLEYLKRLQTLVKKSIIYIKRKLENKKENKEDVLLEEALGEEWKVAKLETMGFVKQNVNLLELGSLVELNETTKEYNEIGFFADINTGEVNYTQNIKHIKELKNKKQKDLPLEVIQTSKLYYDPKEGSKRIRWEEIEKRELTYKDLKNIRKKASPIDIALKEAKDILKKPLSGNIYLKVVKYTKIGICEEKIVVTDTENNILLLGDIEGAEPTVHHLNVLLDPFYIKNQVLLGAFYYDKYSYSIKMQPFTIITKDKIVCLLY